MDITDFMRYSPSKKADLIEGAAALKAMYDANVEAGFTPDQALTLVTTVMSAQIEAAATTEFLERQASGD